MQRHTPFFIIVDALHVSGGFSAHHQELKNCYVPGLLAVTASFQPNHATFLYSRHKNRQFKIRSQD
jgi:hypothetical protein